MGDVSRRGLFALAAGGVGGILLAGGAVPVLGTAAHAAATPALPGEYYRKGNQTTAAGTKYDNIAVRISGDTARIFVPQGLLPGAATPVVWFYHGAGTDAAALENGFRKEAEMVIDRGVVAICQTAGGTLFSHPTAVGLQVAGGEYMRSLFQVTGSVLRSTSAGGALATTAYASRLVPNLVGMYNVNATYDLRAAADAGDARAGAIRSIFNNDDAAIDAANPARYPQSAWTGSRMRIVVASPSSSDTVVPPDQHGLKLHALAQPVAADATVRTHTNAHNTPGFALTDFSDMLDRWGIRDGLPVTDTTAPAVSILSPATGATLSGTVTARVSATDAVGVVDVAFYAGTLRLATATKYSASEWRVTFDTAPRNGTYSITARATDAAGNVGTSAPIRVTLRN